MLDLRRFAKDRGLKFDKQGYRDEVGLMTVTQDDTAFQKAVDVAEILNTMLGSVHSVRSQYIAITPGFPLIHATKIAVIFIASRCMTPRQT